MKTNSFVPMAGRTLIIALACVLPVTFASAQVYSVSVLGYADVDWVAGSNLVANPFDAGQNTVSTVLRGLPDGSFFFSWNPATLEIGSTNFFFESDGWSDPDAILSPLDTGFLWLPAPTRMSFVGEVPVGSGCLNYPQGTSLATVLPEDFCGFCFTEPCGPPPIPDGTVIWKWDAALQQWDASPYYYMREVGWVRNEGPADPQVAPTEAFRIYAPQAFSAFSRKAPGRGRYLPVGLYNWTRSITDLSFQFPANNTNWCLVRSTNLSSKVWEVVPSGTATVTGAVTSVTVLADTNRMAFYRLAPFLPSVHAVLFNPSRNGTSFSFEFYVPVTGNYAVLRTTELSRMGRRYNYPPIQSEMIQTIAASAGTVVTVTDTNATAAVGCYLVRF